MISEFKTPTRIYELDVDKFVCNKFGIAEFFTKHFCAEDLGGGKSVLDVGCGVGPLALFFADQFNCRVVGVEINGDACKCFHKNIRRFELSDFIAVEEENFADYSGKIISQNFDLIVSNPPIDEKITTSDILKFKNSSFKHPNSSEFVYVTNSWHDNNGKDLLDHLFIFAKNHLAKSGKIILTCCSLDGASEKTIFDRAAIYGFTSTKSISGKITTASIGAERSGLDTVDAFYVVLEREVENEYRNS